MEKCNNTILLPHNQEAFEKVMEHFASNQRAAVVHATGTGKSFIIAAVTGHFSKVVVIAPNNFVLDETRKLCGENVTFRTYASVMFDDYPVSGYDLIVLDEFHRAGADKWGEGVARLIAANPEAKLLGTSATAIRYLDNERNMADELFDGNVVSSLPLRDAIDRGIIPEPTYVASLYAFTETYLAVKNRIMVSNKKTEEEKMKAMRTLDGIAHNWKNAQGVGLIMRKYLDRDIKRIIVFCSKVACAEKARKILGPWLASAGFRRMHFYNIDYKEKHLEREMADFQEDNFDGIKVAISVNMLNEGVHIPNVDAVVMMRSSVSPNIILQQIGRCLTAKKTGHKPVIIDLVNNMDTLGDYCGWQFAETKTATGVKDDDPSLDKGFPFHVIDECRDIRVFLTQIQNEFEVVTDFYPKFWEFVNKHGRLPKYGVKEESPLYNFIARISKNAWHEKVTYEDVWKKMLELGWTPVNVISNINAKKLEEFVEHYGRLPKKSVKGEKSLWYWCSCVYNNRRNLRILFPDSYDILIKYGWVSPQEITDKRKVEFMSFIEKNGRLPKKTVEGEKSLYLWHIRFMHSESLRNKYPEVVEITLKLRKKISMDDKIAVIMGFIEKNGRLPSSTAEEERNLRAYCPLILKNEYCQQKYPEAVSTIRKYGSYNYTEHKEARKKEFWDFVGLHGRLPKCSVKEEQSLYEFCRNIDKQGREKYPEEWEKMLELGWKERKPKRDFKSIVQQRIEKMISLSQKPSSSDSEEGRLLWRFLRNESNLQNRFPEEWVKIQNWMKANDIQ